MEDPSNCKQEPLNYTTSSHEYEQSGLGSDANRLGSPTQVNQYLKINPNNSNMGWMNGEKLIQNRLPVSQESQNPQNGPEDVKIKGDINTANTVQNEEPECNYCPHLPNSDILDSHLDQKYNTRCFYCSMLHSYRLSSMASNISGKYNCSECSLHVQDLHGLYAHYKTHIDENSCICNLRIKISSDSQVAMDSTEDSSKLMQCPFCAFSAKRAQDLKRHLIIHTGDRPYQCKSCPYRAQDMSSLRVHNKTHSGERPFQCNECSYRASQKSTLRTHYKVHTGEKPYSCTYCNYKSSNQTNLGSHIKIHTGEKPYSCPYCSYCSTQSSAVKCHLRIHTGEKPYHCSKCPYRAAALGNLKSHTKVHKDS